MKGNQEEVGHKEEENSSDKEESEEGDDEQSEEKVKEEDVDELRKEHVSLSKELPGTVDVVCVACVTFSMCFDVQRKNQ